MLMKYAILILIYHLTVAGQLNKHSHSNSFSYDKIGPDSAGADPEFGKGGPLCWKGWRPKKKGEAEWLKEAAISLWS